MKFLYFLILSSLLSCVENDVRISKSPSGKVGKRITKSEIIDTAKFYGVDSNHVLFADSFLTVRTRVVPTVYVLNEANEAYNIEICNADFPDFNEKVLAGLSWVGTDERKTNQVSEILTHLRFSDGEKFSFNSNGKKVVLLSFLCHKPGESVGYYVENLGNYDPNEFEIYLFTQSNYYELGMKREVFIQRVKNNMKLLDN